MLNTTTVATKIIKEDPPNKPLISIILPTYNRANYLAAAINSILAQEVNFEFEIIVIDDNSTDDTAQIISRINDSRVKYIPLKERHGGGGARNKGIEQSTGKYIGFIDSDVIWLPLKLERQVAKLESSPEYAGTYSTFYKVSPTGKKDIQPKMTYSGWVNDHILRFNFIDTPTAVIRREAIEHVGGFDEALPRFQDWELFIRISKKYQLYCFQQPMIESLDLPDSISRNDLARCDALLHIYKKHEDEFKKKSDLHKIILLKLANANFILGNKQAGISYLRQAKNLLTTLELVAYSIFSALPKKLIIKLNKLKKRL